MAGSAGGAVLAVVDVQDRRSLRKSRVALDENLVNEIAGRRGTARVSHKEKTVFVIDDDDAVRESLSIVLETAGYAARSFTSGTEFLSEIDGHGDGCVLLDTLMPGQGGLEVLRELRAHRPDLPVIMMAGSGGAVSAEDAIRAGAVDYLGKPFLEDALYERIEAAFLLADSAVGATPSTAEVDHARRLIDRLTATEREIFGMLVLGGSQAQIASHLHLAIRDVIDHRDAIMKKMEARNTIQLKRIAFVCGIPIRSGPAVESRRPPAG